ncbi:MAG: MotA/TolQ/ExbB proton channel family protein [Planctomycetota bacterium]
MSEPTTPAASPRPQASNIQSHRAQRVDLGKRRRPMLEWTLYVIGLGLLVSAVAGTFIEQAVRRDLAQAGTREGTYISLIILIIFAFAVFKNFLDMRFINRQTRLTNAQIDQLRQTNNIYTFLTGSEPSLFRDHIDNLHEIFRRDFNISQDNLVTLLQARLLARTRIVDFCSSILVTLGLVGTIIGLIRSADGLGDVFFAMSQGQTTIMEGVKEALGGMGIAFYTTLMGAILGGVCLRLLSNLVDANTEHIVSHIAELTEIYILPILRRAARINEEHQQKLRAQGKGLPTGVPAPGSVPNARITDASAPIQDAEPGGEPPFDPNDETMA